MNSFDGVLFIGGIVVPFAILILAGLGIVACIIAAALLVYAGASHIATPYANPDARLLRDIRRNKV